MIGMKQPQGTKQGTDDKHFKALLLAYLPQWQGGEKPTVVLAQVL